MDYLLDVHQPIQANVTQLIQERIDSCRAALKNTEDPHQGVHQARKDLKRIRALCRMVRTETGNKAYKAANYYFRDVARLLSDARDTAVVIEPLQKLEPHVDTENQVVLQKAKHHFSGKKGAFTRININQELLLQKVEDELKNAEDYYNFRSFKRKGFKAIAPGLEKAYSHARHSMKRAYAKKSDKYFHEWRKQVKYLRYQLDALQPLWPRMLSAWEKELHQLTDLLGEDHDLDVLRDQFRNMEWEEGMNPKAILKTIKARRKALRKQAHPLAQKLFHQRPTDFVTMIRDYWKVKLEE